MKFPRIRKSNKSVLFELQNVFLLFPRLRNVWSMIVKEFFLQTALNRDIKNFCRYSLDYEQLNNHHSIGKFSITKVKRFISILQFFDPIS